LITAYDSEKKSFYNCAFYDVKFHCILAYYYDLKIPFMISYYHD